ncbi:MAG: hypothetical protein FWD77_11625 [Betaproteobacteria bacterium]|nr:hypothetical protein [Betaproteobacteria bacterium]
MDTIGMVFSPWKDGKWNVTESNRIYFAILPNAEDKAGGRGFSPCIGPEDRSPHEEGRKVYS